MSGLAWAPGPPPPPILSVDRRLPGRRNLQRPVTQSQRSPQMCPWWVSRERSPKKRLPGAVMKRLMVRVILKNPVNLPLLFHREESEYQVLLHWLSLVSVFCQSLIPYLQSIKKLHSQTQFQQRRNSHAQTDTEYTKPRN
ncbi:B double prime 1, subunit of RNA polymerase III transcription initiation factor IIIB [Phyllostomus discolor]|uniref:B double prime 1, subunit of RNA polymerase III transcription initiation factor IIIB n=1 Tax=Phyllostomus discolor TaxID=89673 RepID=A0A834B4M4_9CHIR|nr:B double prime 1, subunit of RNA polymerase III transcription initiation factor IIIB [Phyllostomus discolor]